MPGGRVVADRLPGGGVGDEWWAQIGLTGGYAVEPEQSTLAIVAHLPQAVYFGMKSGRLPEDAAPDAIIAGSERDPSSLDEDPPDGPVEEESEPALASSSGRAGAE